MPQNKLTLVIEGKEYTGWTRVSVRRSLETLCGSFSASLIDASKAIINNIKPSVLCEVYFDNDKILTGYIDEYSPEISTTARALSVAGRCKTSDLIDCSAIYKTGSWSGNVPLLTICKNLCAPFGITVTAQTDLGSNLDNFTLNQGESPFEAMKRACDSRAVILLSDVNGNLILATSGTMRASDSIYIGRNLLSIECRWNYGNRFSVYQVRGSASSGGDGWGSDTEAPKTITVQGVANDENFPRYRPKIISASGIVSTGDAKKQAAWELQTRAGKSNSLSVRIQGWRQSTGELWKENLLVSVNVPELLIDGEFLTSEIEYSQSDSDGTIALLSLVPPDTFAPNPTQTKKKKAKSESWGGWK